MPKKSTSHLENELKRSESLEEFLDNNQDELSREELPELLQVLLPGQLPALAGLVLIGLGCAPIYPGMMHATPQYFGTGNSQSMIGLQAAAASAGVCLMPAAFGFIANHIGVALMPLYLLIMLAVMAAAHRKLEQPGKESSH